MPNIDTSKVKAIASEMIDINNRYKDDFSAVEQAINRLKNDWQQPQKVSSAAFACFDEIKAKFFEPSITERRELAQFLCDAVGIGYEEAENTNKNLLEQLFEHFVGNSIIGTAISTATNVISTVKDKSDDYKTKQYAENFITNFSERCKDVVAKGTRGNYRGGGCVRLTFDKLDYFLDGQPIKFASGYSSSGDGKDVYARLAEYTPKNDEYGQKKYAGKDCLSKILSEQGDPIYNILVSFPTNPIVEGVSRNDHGHVMVIDAIIDGKVYYSDTSSNGLAKTADSVNDFLAHYKKYGNGDPIGAVHFYK